MSAVDQARAVLQQFASVPGFVDAIERFEAAVRANERSGATTAAVLREAADWFHQHDSALLQAQQVAELLRRRADEEQP